MVDIFVAGDVVNCKPDTLIQCSKPIKSIISECDYSICNFEAPISGAGSPQIKSGPHLSQHRESIPTLQNLGFNLLLLANNHIMDYGKKALADTIDIAKQCDLDVIGAGLDVNQAYRPIIKEIESIKIGIINCCEAQFGAVHHEQSENVAGYAWVNDPLIDKNIIELKNKCDLVLVFPHAGLEHYSIPQKEWRERYRHFCDLGADVVIGSHPHVPQGYERYNKSLIFYSLGNFYFDYASYDKTLNKTYSVIIKYEKDEKLTFDLVYTQVKDNVVQLCEPENRIDIEYLNSLLKDDMYESLHRDMTMKAYKMIKKYQAMSSYPFPTDGTILGTFKEIIMTLIGKRRNLNKSVLKLHLLRNETYRNASINALENNISNKFGMK